MKRQDVENYIISAIEAQADAPSAHILDAAKAKLRAKRMSKRFIVIGWVAATLVVLICLAVALPLALGNGGQNANIEKSQHISMQRYLDEQGVNINTYEKLPTMKIDGNTGISVPSSDGTYPNYYGQTSYHLEYCSLVQRDGVPLYIEGAYRHNDGDYIVCYVLLSEDIAVKKEFFAKYLKLNREYTVYKRVPFLYTCDKNYNGLAVTDYYDHTVFLYIKSDSENHFFMRIAEFVLSQNK